ncbi:hypothetical protein C2E23DRAFT_40579 [Lenzites betulinus]|nr:hypothetical protein C2E23DRAFT_40579 [Lenzites betulinus]
MPQHCTTPANDDEFQFAAAPSLDIIRTSSTAFSLDRSPFLSCRRLQCVVEDTPFHATVADELECFTYTLLHTHLRRRKRDGELTVEECAMLRKMDDDDPDIRVLVQNRMSLAHNVGAMHTAEKGRLPGDDKSTTRRGLGRIATGILGLLHVHRAQRSSVAREPGRDGSEKTESERTTAREHYRSYIAAIVELKRVERLGDEPIVQQRVASRRNIARLKEGAHHANQLEEESEEPRIKTAVGSRKIGSGAMGKENRPLDSRTR